MFTKNIFIVCIVFFALTVYGQKGIVNNGAKIIVGNGAYIKVQGDNTTGYTNQSSGSHHGRIDLDGKIEVCGFFNNNATDGTVFINRNETGTVSFTGTSVQTIGGTQNIRFENVDLSGGNITLQTDMSLSGALTFGSGLLNLNESMLSFESAASVAGTPSATSMIVQGSNGVVRKYYATAGSFTYPIGDNADYLPVIVNFTTGTFGGGAYLDVQMKNVKHPQNINTTDYINRYWDLSEHNMSAFAASLSFTYADGDIVGTENNLSTLGYDGTFWNIYDAATIPTNKLTASVTQFEQFTGGTADVVTPQIIWIANGTIQEGMEDGKEIYVKILNDEFVPSINPNQWTVSGLPNGVSVANIIRTTPDSVTITLAGNREDDFDTDISLSLNVNASQLVYTTTGNLTPATNVVIVANNDDESLTMVDDGSILEGAEDGEVIQVNLIGGTFSQTLSTANWVAANMPAGVSTGAITRVSESLVEITLNGNTTVDYNTNITNFQLTIPASDVNEYDGSNFLLTTGVTFKAIDESIVISMTDGGLGINEEAENGHVIEVSIDERVFANSLTLSEWTMFNMPQGVSIGTVVRANDTAVHITLSGNRLVDYDSDITNAQLTIGVSQITGVSNDVTVSTGVTFNATDDDESISFSPSATITEGAENGAEITVTVTGGTLSNNLTPSEWAFSGLPSGVTIGAITRVDEYNAVITLSGNAAEDYDSDITVSELIVAGSQVDDYNEATLIATGTVTFSAIIESYNLSLTSLSELNESNLDGAQISIRLNGATFTSSLNLSDLTINNNPVGLTLAGVTEITADSAVLDIAFDGSDFDVDYPNFSVTLSETGSNLDVAIISNVINISAIIEVGSLQISHAGLTEENLNGAVVDVLLVNDEFADGTLDLSNFTIHNTPSGCQISSVTYLSTTTATIELEHNGSDFDVDFDNVQLELQGVELLSGNTSQSNVLSITATNDVETIVFVNQQNVTEGNENGSTFTVELSGGQFANSLNEADWTLSYLPQGVEIGSITRVDATHAIIQLQGNTTVDYDVDETVSLTIQSSQYNAGDVALVSDNTFDFEALIETLTSLTDTISEANLNTVVLGFELTNDWLTNTSPSFTDFIIQNAPTGLEISTVNVADSTHFTLEFNYTGTFLNNDEQFSIMIADNILNGVEALISNEIVIDAVSVGINGIQDEVKMYTTATNIVLKQKGTIQKGDLLVYALDGRKVQTFKVERKSVNIFHTSLRDNIYLIQFKTLNGEVHNLKGFIKN